MIEKQDRIKRRILVRCKYLQVKRHLQKGDKIVQGKWRRIKKERR
jgi:hypothetical protein